MERAAFLIETSGTRIGCLLNPSTVEIKRLAGIRRRSSANGPLTGSELSDDPLLYTGGGSTEISLELLFDVTLAGSTVSATDVRALTGPLWDLAENQPDSSHNTVPPAVRFVWGKYWNIPGVITAIAQRLEYFAEDGAPRRAWVRLRMLRTGEPSGEPEAAPVPLNPFELPETGPSEFTPPETAVETIGAGTESPADEKEAPEGTSGVRLDQLAHDYFRDPAAWRLIAIFNGIADPLRIAAGTLIRIPNISTGKTS
jgi:Contractile injection system tube protein